jgi:dihydrofolate synthase/folylpolyglutamate synthase
MDYPKALAWLYGTQQFGIKPGLDNTRKLLKALQLPGTRQRFLHVAGTNGKGSTCAFMESVLRAGRERTALFTSPHLIQFRERIQVGGVMMPEAEIARSLTAMRDLVSRWQPHPTFFELTLALALDWFDRSGAEWVVLETGMGGRLDSTNAIKPAVSIITPIAMDHQQWLGDTLTKIAGEKAGIIKPGVPVVSAPQHPDAEAVLRAAAAAAGTPIFFITKPWTGANADDAQTDPAHAAPPEEGGHSVCPCLETAQQMVDPPQLPLAGEHQQWNAALALTALDVAGCLPKPPAVLAGLTNTVWPARFQSLMGGRLIIDGAHNPHSIARLVTTWQQQFGPEKAHLIFGAVEGKDHAISLPLLAEIVSGVTFVTVDSPRAIPSAALAKTWHETVPGIPCQESPSLRETLHSKESHRTKASLSGADKAPRRLLCGSLYLCGEVLSLVEGGAFESSAQ